MIETYVQAMKRGVKREEELELRHGQNGGTSQMPTKYGQQGFRKSPTGWNGPSGGGNGCHDQTTHTVLGVGQRIRRMVGGGENK